MPGSAMIAIYFGTETIGSTVSGHPIYAEYTGRLIGNIEGPASSGRKTWRVIVKGSRIGDFKTAELAKEAAEAIES